MTECWRPSSMSKVLGSISNTPKKKKKKTGKQKKGGRVQEEKKKRAEGRGGNEWQGGQS